jgi:hypothetical protein
MLHKTFTQIIPTGEIFKISIFKNYDNGGIYYTFRYINTNLEIYKKLPSIKKDLEFGIEGRDKNNNLIKFTNPDKLENEIKAKIGITHLDNN